MGRWIARRSARRKAQRVGLEVLSIVRDVVETFGDVIGIQQEVARRVAESDFLSTRGLAEIKAIDEREATWLKGLK